MAIIQMNILQQCILMTNIMGGYLEICSPTGLSAVMEMFQSLMLNKRSRMRNNSISTKLNTDKTKQHIDQRCIYSGKTTMKSKKIYKIHTRRQGIQQEQGTHREAQNFIIHSYYITLKQQGRETHGCYTFILKLYMNVVHMLYMYHKFKK